MLGFAILLAIGGVLIAAAGYFVNESSDDGSLLARDVVDMGGALAAVGLLLLALALILGPDEAGAHEAPTGWSYPVSCCSGYDCREVPASAIGETPQGYLIKSSGLVVGHGDNRIRESPDGLVHLCCKGANFDRCQPLCLFVPPRSY